MQAIFDDCAASFEWFRQRCGLNNSIEENKNILRQKIEEAKSAGERANQSKNTIAYLKNSIEAIRRERLVGDVCLLTQLKFMDAFIARSHIQSTGKHEPRRRRERWGTI
jgi:hypothetical protein